jgi:hypothetical protein
MAFERRDVDRREFLAASSCQCGVDTDPIQPREEGGLAAIPVEIAPSLDEGVLDGLLDVSRVVEDAKQNKSKAALVTAYDLREGVEVSPLRKRNEIRVGFTPREHAEIVRLRNEPSCDGV